MPENSFNIAQKSLEKDGFVVLESILSSEECLNYKNLLEQHYSDFSNLYFQSDQEKSHSLANKSTEKVVYNLHNKDLAWLYLFDHPEILPIISIPLQKGSYQDKEPFYLYNNSARNPLRGGGFQQLHTDSNLPGCNYEMVLNVVWAFDDMSEQNGSTRIIPGSHKWKAYPEDGIKDLREQSVELKKGSVLIFSGALWHGGGLNISGADRWALLLGYSRWFYKPSFDYMHNTPLDLFNQYSDSQKELLGFNVVPPKDEFTRLKRKSDIFEIPNQNTTHD